MNFAYDERDSAKMDFLNDVRQHCTLHPNPWLHAQVLARQQMTRRPEKVSTHPGSRSHIEATMVACVGPHPLIEAAMAVAARGCPTMQESLCSGVWGRGAWHSGASAEVAGA
jgi:hypothetical protein